MSTSRHESIFNKYPKYKDDLIRLYEREGKQLCDKIKTETKKFKKNKKIWKEKVNKWFFNTATLESLVLNRSLRGLKYKLKPLKDNEPDYKLLKNAFDSDGTEHNLLKKCKIKDLKIHKIVSTDNTEENEGNGEHLLLLHGTKGQNIQGILKEGFKPSTDGTYGTGVYMTNSFTIASGYGTC